MSPRCSTSAPGRRTQKHAFGVVGELLFVRTCPPGHLWRERVLPSHMGTKPDHPQGRQRARSSIAGDRLALSGVRSGRWLGIRSEPAKRARLIGRDAAGQSGTHYLIHSGERFPVSATLQATSERRAREATRYHASDPVALRPPTPTIGTAPRAVSGEVRALLGAPHRFRSAPIW